MSHSPEDVQASRRLSGRPPKVQSQLHDLILIAVHRACDLGEYEAARELLAAAEATVRARVDMPFPKRRQALDALTAAHERLWFLQHDVEGPGTEQ